MFIQLFMSIKLHFSVGPLWNSSLFDFNDVLTGIGSVPVYMWS